MRRTIKGCNGVFAFRVVAEGGADNNQSVFVLITNLRRTNFSTLESEVHPTSNIAEPLPTLQRYAEIYRLNAKNRKRIRLRGILPPACPKQSELRDGCPTN
jgi:hypothetical protein